MLSEEGEKNDAGKERRETEREGEEKKRESEIVVASFGISSPVTLLSHAWIGLFLIVWIKIEYKKMFFLFKK